MNITTTTAWKRLDGTSWSVKNNVILLVISSCIDSVYKQLETFQSLGGGGAASGGRPKAANPPHHRNSEKFLVACRLNQYMMI